MRTAEHAAFTMPSACVSVSRCEQRGFLTTSCARVQAGGAGVAGGEARAAGGGGCQGCDGSDLALPEGSATQRAHCSSLFGMRDRVEALRVFAESRHPCSRAAQARRLPLRVYGRAASPTAGWILCLWLLPLCMEQQVGHE